MRSGYRCRVIPPPWMLLAFAGWAALLGAISGSGYWYLLDLSRTVSVVEVIWTLEALGALLFISWNSVDAYADADALHQGADEAVHIVACGNLRGELLLLMLAAVNLLVGIVALLTPVPIQEANRISSGVVAGIFMDAAALLMWTSIENRRDRRRLLHLPFWPVRKGPLDRLLRRWLGLRP